MINGLRAKESWHDPCFIYLVTAFAAGFFRIPNHKSRSSHVA